MSENKNFENMLHDSLMKEADSMPASLSAENITELVSDKTPAKAKSPFKKVVALAASLAIVVSAVAIGAKYYKPAVKPIKTDGDPQTVDTAKDYGEIQSFFIELKNSTVQTSLGERYEINKFFNVGSSKNAVEDAATALPEASGSPASAQSNTGGYEADGMGGGPASETEVQVQGVDEADIIKNDGRYLYCVRQNDSSKLLVIDPSDPCDMKIIAEIEIKADADYDPNIFEFYLKDNRLIIITNNYLENYNTKYGWFDDVCCFYGSGETRTGVYIYDITDKANPQHVSEYTVEGTYTSSRMIDGDVVLVTNYIVPLYNDDEALKEECIPTYWFNSKEYKIPADRICILENNTENTYTVALKLNAMADSEEPVSTAVLGGSDQIYCNQTDLYVARWNYISTRDSYEEYTDVFRFDLTDGISYKGKVSLLGGILNQFSMDEYNGYFRVATCLRNKESIIHVLDKSLNEVGTLKGLADGESIYAVRFMGDTAYVVTFFQTDPLFVIDLSDPTRPTVAGELKIPGFSNMLYPYGDNYLIGIGMDGDENGTNGDLKVSLYDISDKQNPREVSKAVIQGYADSVAAYEHKAFMRFGETGEFAIPVNGNSYYLCSFRVEDGKISAYKKYVVNDDDNNYCYVQRGAYIGNTVFALTDSELVSFDRESTQRLGSVDMSYQGGDDVVLYDTYSDYAEVTEPDVIVVN